MPALTDYPVVDSPPCVAMSFKSGFISIIGRPNVGKSTLLNTIIGSKIAIVSEKPQTTRNRITGIKNIEGGQIVFIDTPGIHGHRGRLNRYMLRTALATLEEVDVIFFVVEAGIHADVDEETIIKKLKRVDRPVILCINKIDKVSKDKLLQTISQYAELYVFREFVPVSAASGEGVDGLLRLSVDILPEGPRYFPEDSITDLPERFIVAEIIREKIFISLWQEVPYSVAVLVDKFDERPSGDLISISASIVVERASQKGIIIGRGGKKLKEIGSKARRDIEALLGIRIYLELLVKVRKDWSGDLRKLKEFGYH